MLSTRILKCFVILGVIGIIQVQAMETSKNLTNIKWSHETNSQQKLQEALQNKAQMIEGDIILGKLSIDDINSIPIMAHPPATTSDLSLQMFLEKIFEYNNKNAILAKGVKLDFKTIEGYENSELIVTNYTKYLKTIWLNADILTGPGNSTTLPVLASSFLNVAKRINQNSTLSIGWTTYWNTSLSKAKYEQKHIDEMVKVIQDNQIVKRHITFPVRAVFAINSLKELQNLLLRTNQTDNNSTLTIWSDKNDVVDDKKLSSFILDIGLQRVYLDVPPSLEQKLKLKNSAGFIKASLFNITIISILFILLSAFINK